MKRRLISTIIFVLFLAIDTGANEYHVIPRPKQLVAKESVFQFSPKTVIYYSEGLERHAQMLSAYLRNAIGCQLALKEGKKLKSGSILLKYDPSLTCQEAYRLQVTKDGVEITAVDGKGIFYGIQTLRQLFPPEVFSTTRVWEREVWPVPCVEIYDEPQFAWRGMMLDVARYFLSLDYVKRYIDIMSTYKMNVLHFHLVDDSGWRLEIKKYPKLTEIGAFNGEGEKKSGGFYTQEELRELVKYAAERNVTIVPEIEFPAHILSAVSAYPWLSCRGEQLSVPDQHYISKDLLCVGKDSAITFLKDVLTETFDIFPGKYLHIGGDEAVYTYWEQCKRCQEVMRREGLKKASELQAYLTNLVAGFAAKHGRKIVGWDEILQRGKIDCQVASMIWRNMKFAQEALDMGQEVVLAPADYAYLDFPETRFPSEIKAATWKDPISVQKCYHMDLSPYENNKLVLGAQGCLWTDQFIHGYLLQELPLLNENRSENYVNYMILPRMLALSEVVWCNSKDKNFEDFRSRLASHFERLDRAGYNFCIPYPTLKEQRTLADGRIAVKLETYVPHAQIHYTTDGSKPSYYSRLYQGEEIELVSLTDLRAVVTLSPQKMSVPLYIPENYSKYKQYGVFLKKVTAADVKKTSGKIVKIEATGKISGNGRFLLTFVPLTSQVNAKISGVEMLKRNEIIGHIDQERELTDGVVQVEFDVDSWQAGTPYFIQHKIETAASHQGNYAVFIKKVN
ncbi:MAG: family 20 glycosylhydrolase [Odoribacter sp.]